MKLIAVTQRVELNRSERRDALDQAWVRFLGSLDYAPILIPNQPSVARHLWQRTFCEGLLLTGGNDLADFGGDAPERDETEAMLLADARRQRCPVVGICRGMQLIQKEFGVSLRQVAGHVQPDQEIIINDRREMVNSYHQIGAFDTVSELSIWARAADGVVKAIRHVAEPIIGLMWHPERLSPFREQDLRLFRSHFGARS